MSNLLPLSPTDDAAATGAAPPDGDPDGAAWLSLLRPRLHRYCARLVGSSLDGEDVVQDAVERALAALADGAEVDNREGWLFRIAHNAAMDHLRRQSRHAHRHDDADLDRLTDRLSSAEQRAVARTALHVFMGLPVAQRATVILMDVLGYELAEIGKLLDLTLAATKSSLHRGRVRLREMARAERPPRLPTLSDADRQRHLEYASLFNARDFDAIRKLLAEDVRLDVINASTLRGSQGVGSYFGNYARLPGWTVTVGIVEQRLAIVFGGAGGPNVVLLDWAGQRIQRIRDYRHAPYVMDGLSIENAG